MIDHRRIWHVPARGDYKERAGTFAACRMIWDDLILVERNLTRVEKHSNIM